MHSFEASTTAPGAMLRNLPGGHSSGTFTPCDWQASGRTIPDCFAEIADRFPDRLATFDFTRRLTYGELDRAANRIAHAPLAQCGGDREPVITPRHASARRMGPGNWGYGVVRHDDDHSARP